MMTEWMNMLGKGADPGQGMALKGKSLNTGKGIEGDPSGKSEETAFLDAVLGMAASGKINPQDLLDWISKTQPPEIVTEFMTKISQMMTQAAVDGQTLLTDATPLQAGGGDQADGSMVPSAPSLFAAPIADAGARKPSGFEKLAEDGAAGIPDAGMEAGDFAQEVLSKPAAQILEARPQFTLDTAAPSGGQNLVALWNPLEQESASPMPVDGSPQANPDADAQVVWHQVAEKTAETPAARTAAPVTEFAKTDILQQVLDKVHVQLNDGRSEIRVALRPPDLGRVHLTISTDQNLVTVKIVADLPVVRDVIESQIHQLKSELMGHGLEVEQINVELQSESGFSGQGRRDADHLNPGSGQGSGADTGGQNGVPEGESLSRGSQFTPAGRIDFFA